MDFSKIKNNKFKVLLCLAVILIVSLVLYYKPITSNLPLGLDALSHVSKASYIQQHGLVSWDMSWYSGTPFLKFYSPLFYLFLALFNNIIYGALFLCFLSILLCSIGIFFLVRNYTKDYSISLITSLFFLSVINISYYFISVGNYPFIFSLWAIPFTMLFLEKTIISKNYFLLYCLFFVIGFLSHIFIGFILLFLAFVKILTYSKITLKRFFRDSLIFIIIPVGLCFFWLLPFLSKSSSFVGDEIFIPKISSLFGIEKTVTWGVGVDSIGLVLFLFVFVLFFFKKGIKDRTYLFLFISSVALFMLLMGVLGSYYPKGIGSIRFIPIVSMIICIFVGYSLHSIKFPRKILILILILLVCSLFINFNVIKNNFKDYSYHSDDKKFEQFGTIHKDFFESGFPIDKNPSIYRFGSARFPFSRDLTFVFPNISQTGGYYDQGIIYENTFSKMKSSIWDSNNLNKTLYYLDWFGVEFFEVSGGYLRDYSKKFENSSVFELVFEKTNNTYPYRIYRYKNASPIISVIQSNFVSFSEINDSLIDSSSENNENTKFLVPFESDEIITLFNEYSILNADITRRSPDFVEINYNKFTGNEGILFKESYYPSWKAKEFPLGKSIEIYRTANDFMLVIPHEESNKVIFYQSKSILDYFGIIISIISLIFVIFIYSLNKKK